MDDKHMQSWSHETVLDEDVAYTESLQEISGHTPQWSSIFSPFSHASPFMEQFDVGIDSAFWTRMDPIPSLSDTTLASPSYASDSPTAHSQTCTCGHRGDDHQCQSRQSLPNNGGRARAEPHTPSTESTASADVSQDTVQSPMSRHKVRIQRADHPPKRPKRTKKTHHFCAVEGCGRVFTCAYDLKRHMDDIHAQGDWIYKCDEPACGFVRPRKDKVKDHCAKRRHRAGFSSIFVGDSQNAAELQAMTEQRRKKGKRRSICEGCGRRRDG